MIHTYTVICVYHDETLKKGTLKQVILKHGGFLAILLWVELAFDIKYIG